MKFPERKNYKTDYDYLKELDRLIEYALGRKKKIPKIDLLTSDSVIDILNKN